MNYWFSCSLCSLPGHFPSLSTFSLSTILFSAKVKAWTCLSSHIFQPNSGLSMPFIFFTVGNPFSPEKKKLRENVDDFDDLTAVKAAAWAWYERGAGSESKPPPVFDITRTQKSLGPSRYKLEAITMAEKALKAEEEEKHTRNRLRPLLDSYEIERFSKHFVSLVEPGRRSVGDEFLPAESFRWTSVSPASENGDLLRKKKKKKQKEKIGGIWLTKNAPVCGIGKNMVDAKAIIPRRSPEKHARVVRVSR